jgi:hypothetical protein
MKISAHFLVSTIDFYLLGCVSAETTNPTHFHWRLKTNSKQSLCIYTTGQLRKVHVYNRANKEIPCLRQVIGSKSNPHPNPNRNRIEIEKNPP